MPRRRKTPSRVRLWEAARVKPEGLSVATLDRAGGQAVAQFLALADDLNGRIEFENRCARQRRDPAPALVPRRPKASLARSGQSKKHSFNIVLKTFHQIVIN